MKKNKKSENQKALPKFFGILILAALFGGLLGGAAGFFSGTNLPDRIIDQIYRVLTIATPYSFWVITAVFGVAELANYRRAKTAFAAWDGEDEAVIEQVEENLSWVLVLTSINQVLDFFFMSLLPLLDEGSVFTIVLAILGFLMSFAVLMFTQQKTVDFIKKINPEKKGSVYDMKFQKKWMDSCDENEQRQIGQASFKAFKATNYTCILLFVVLMVLSTFHHVGILPPFLVALIFGVSQVSYGLECIRLGHHH